MGYFDLGKQRLGAWLVRTLPTELPHERRHKHMYRKLVVPAAAILGALLLSSAPAMAVSGPHEDSWPTQINLPDGWAPEGIGIGKQPYAYFGNGVNGSLYRADLRTGQGKVVSGPAGEGAGGIKVDDRDGLVFMTGCFGGDGRVYSEKTGQLIKTYQFTAPSKNPDLSHPFTASTCINDVVVTQGAAWWTDTFSTKLYKVPIGTHGQLAAEAQTLNVTGDYHVADVPNDISATPDGTGLIVSMTRSGTLVRVDPRTGVAKTVDLGTEKVPGADGILLQGRTLYVVQDTVTKIELNPSGTAGKVIARVSDSRFDRITSVASYGDRLYLPNARDFRLISPSTKYNAVAIPKF